MSHRSLVWNRSSSSGSPRPFFDKVTLHLPRAKHPLVISSKGAPHKPYIKSVSVNGKKVHSPVITHADIAAGGHLKFEMSDKPQAWSSSTLVSSVSRSGCGMTWDLISVCAL